MKMIIPVLIGLACFGQTLLAGGSLDLSEIEPLLQQQPQLWKFYQDNFEIPSVIWGLRLGGGRDFPLYGFRIGPYSMQVKDKTTGVLYELCIQTDTIFQDANGKSVESHGDPSVQVKEILRGITLKPKDYMNDPQPIFLRKSGRKSENCSSAPSPSPQ